MNIRHQSAKPEHYNYAADKYDAIYENNPEIDNKVIENILKKNKAKTVVDLSCGTGHQSIYLAKKRYLVSGFDINKKMLAVAKRKITKSLSNLSFNLGDMRTTKAGKFDAAITIFNAIGHVTKSDFKKTLKNIYKNLKSNGIYVFDIFNLDYMLYKDNITSLTIDQMVQSKDKIIRKMQYSTVDDDGVLASHTISIVKKGASKPIHASGSQTLQIYSVSMLKELLAQCGFKMVEKLSIDGAKFSKNKTKHMLIVAKRVSDEKRK